tara:strand:+ start:1386 stop:1967 length:582 start_codon:yes stop_codon:yes gene_type:complete
MVSLTNNVSRSNVRQRWEDYVADAARAGISWGYNRKPFSQAPNSWFGGNYNSPPARSSYASDNTVGSSGGIIYASTLRNGLTQATRNWTHLRRMRAVRYINSQGTYYLQVDSQAKAYQTTSVRANVTAAIPTNGPNAGNLITIGSDSSNTGLEEYFARLRASYYNVQNSRVYRRANVCHYSCHSSCHGSRGRR